MRSSVDQNTLLYLQKEVLQKTEKITWKGRPAPLRSAAIGSVKLFGGLFTIAFGIVWTVQTLPNITSFAEHDFFTIAGLFTLFGIAFIASGVWAILTPFRNYIRAGRTYYAITNQRVLIIMAGKNYRVVSITPSEIVDYQRTDKGNGFGDLRLRKTINKNDEEANTTTEFVDGLWGVPDVKGAADAIAAIKIDN